MKQLLAILAMSGLSISAYAQDLPPFEDVDVNGDGSISEAEANEVEALDFATADVNQDGSISREEYSQLS